MIGVNLTLYELKPAFQARLRPFAARLVGVGISANQVTLATCVTSIGLGIALAATPRVWILLPPFLLIRMALNAIDGIMAKEHGQASRVGGILNELCDVISDAALTLPVALLPGWSRAGVGAAVMFAALTEVAGMLGRSRRFDGPFGKSDRALALGVLGAWIALGWPLSSRVSQAVPIVWVALCCVTIFNRMRHARDRRQ